MRFTNRKPITIILNVNYEINNQHYC